ncbi:Uma2 family endonuclease [Alkalinema pantanalense CENA528]|uniref:Uma2 family endonuclease n=1 Tax=Alkalinema pantanalense TaxID=1620705 RepID=UPI003D6F24D6
MTVTTASPQLYTAEAYLEREVQSQTRHEFRSGEIVPRTGGTPAHNEIVGNLLFRLKSALKSQPYSIFVTDQRLWVPASNLYTYPDIMIVPRPVELQPGRKDTVMNPIVIAEVLSESTKAYDRDEKFAAYRSIPTFQEYLLIDQYQFHVEHYVKQRENQWLFTEYNNRSDKVILSTVATEIMLADLYENLELLGEADVEKL